MNKQTCFYHRRVKTSDQTDMFLSHDSKTSEQPDKFLSQMSKNRLINRNVSNKPPIEKNLRRLKPVNKQIGF